MSLPALPLPLLLLVHLHLLEFPYANKPEYDHSVFDPKARGLRDRTKSMEDILFFLLSKLETKKDRVKAIITKYPCVSPMDTVAFRTTMAKYIESLRYQAIKENKAWWWRDVIVRKSLLEECAGERFERLLVALSTQALFGVFPTYAPEPQLPDLSQQYASRLQQFRTAYSTWCHSSAKIMQRQANLDTISDDLASNDSSTFRYPDFSVERLITLSVSMKEDLQNVEWSKESLSFVTDLVGLGSSSQPDLRAMTDGFQNAAKLHQVIAAAHHPFELRKLQKPISRPLTPSMSEPESNIRLHSTTLLGLELQAEQDTERLLEEALTKAKRINQELSGKLSHLRAIQTQSTQRPSRPRKFTLWTDLPQQEVNFEAEMTPELLKSLVGGLTEDDEDDDENTALEQRIAAVREDFSRYPLFESRSPSPEPPPTSLEEPTNRPKSVSFASLSRQSRLSLAMGGHRRRPSLFRPLPVSEEEARIDALVDGIEDSSLSFETEPHPMEKSKSGKEKAKLVDVTPRTHTRYGVPSATNSNRKPSFQIPLDAPSSLNLLDFDLSLREEDGSAEGGKAEKSDGCWDKSANKGRESEGDVYEEAPSMTLRDILLRAQVDSEMDLMNLKQDELGDGEDVWS